MVLNRGLLNLYIEFSKQNFTTTTTKNIISLMERGIRNRLGNMERSNTLSICTFLDPRFKTHAFQSLDSAENVKKYHPPSNSKMVSGSIPKTMSMTENSKYKRIRNSYRTSTLDEDVPDIKRKIVEI